MSQRLDVQMEQEIALVELRFRGMSLRSIGPALIRPVLCGPPTGLAMSGKYTHFEYPPVVELFAAAGAGLIVYLLVALPRRQFSKRIARGGEVDA
jgi:hypothetical protein